MSDLSLKVLNLIEEGYTINSICDSLGLSHKQLYNIFRTLRQFGMEFNKKYYYDGEVMYSLKKDLSWDTKKHNVNIVTSPSCNEFKALIISDLHIGNELESVGAWHKIFDYCVVNNIHINIIAGDFLDGITIGRNSLKKHSHPLEQMRYAINSYPFDKNILNFVILGNHDVDSLASYGMDFATYLRNFRPDIVPLGYGHGRINVKNDKIFVTHPIGITNDNSMELSNNYLVFKGHHHTNKSIIGNTGNTSICVPTLSNLFISEEDFLPAALVMTAKFKNGFFDVVNIDNLLIDTKVHIVSSFQYNITLTKDKNFDGKIKHEEDFSKRKILKK